MTAFGHSYGSVNTEFALREPNPTGGAVVFASPARRHQPRAAVHVPAGNLYDERAVTDPVAASRS